MANKYTRKYACTGGFVPRHSKPNKRPSEKFIKARDLPKLYKIIHWECAFSDDEITNDLIKLTPRPNGDYKHHLNVLKTERLLYGI